MSIQSQVPGVQKVTGPSFTVLAPAGVKATITTAPASVATVGQHLSLGVSLTNTGQEAGVLAAEAVIINSGGAIVGTWYSNAHPSGSFPGNYDDPAWTQQRQSVAPGGVFSAGFGTSFGSAVSGNLQTIVYVAVLPTGYTGPIVTGKAPGGAA